MRSGQHDIYCKPVLFGVCAWRGCQIEQGGLEAFPLSSVHDVALCRQHGKGRSTHFQVVTGILEIELFCVWRQQENTNVGLKRWKMRQTSLRQRPCSTYETEEEVRGQELQDMDITNESQVLAVVGMQLHVNDLAQSAFHDAQLQAIFPTSQTDVSPDV